MVIQLWICGFIIGGLLSCLVCFVPLVVVQSFITIATTGGLVKYVASYTCLLKEQERWGILKNTQRR